MIALIFLIVFIVTTIIAAVFAIYLAIDRESLKQSQEKMKKDLNDAQTRAATLFVDKSRLQSQLNSIQTSPGNMLGFSYTPYTKGAGATLIHVQGIINELQKVVCPETKAAFEDSKKQIIDSIKANTTNKPLSCAKIMEQVRKYNQTLDEQAKMHSISGSVENLQNYFLQLWETVTKEICNDQGVVDLDLLDAYMTAIYKSFCSK